MSKANKILATKETHRAHQMLHCISTVLSLAINISPKHKPAALHACLMQCTMWHIIFTHHHPDLPTLPSTSPSTSLNTTGTIITGEGSGEIILKDMHEDQ
jgi:hypothetical protein